METAQLNCPGRISFHAYALYIHVHVSRTTINTLLKHVYANFADGAIHAPSKRGKLFFFLILFLSEVSVTAHNERFVVVLSQDCKPSSFPDFSPENRIIIP